MGLTTLWLYLAQIRLKNHIRPSDRVFDACLKTTAEGVHPVFGDIVFERFKASCRSVYLSNVSTIISLKMVLGFWGCFRDEKNNKHLQC